MAHPIDHIRPMKDDTKPIYPHSPAPNQDYLDWLDHSLEALDIEYDEKLTALARKVFDSKVRPFVKRRKLRFYSGNGTWWIGKYDNGREQNSLDDYDAKRDPVWNKVYLILCSAMEKNHDFPLGSIMPSYDWKEGYL
jgi:hypothetical protein